MSQNVLQISTSAPLKGLDMVVGVNAALTSLATLFSGVSAPTTSVLGVTSLAGLVWHDTGANKLWLRDQADSGWILLGNLDEEKGVFHSSGMPAFTVSSGALIASPEMSGQMLEAAAAVTLTLPASSSLHSGWTLSLFARDASATMILANAEDSLNGVTGGNLILPRGYLAQIRTDAAGTYSVLVTSAGMGISVVASATAVDLGLQAGRTVSVTGSTAISSLGASTPAGMIYTLLFAGSLTLIHDPAALILPGGDDVITAVGDAALFLSLGQGNWRCIGYQSAQTRGSGSLSVPVRHAVLSGVADGNGRAAFITTGSGLAPGLTATAKPLVMTFADGFGTSGAVDYVETVTADTAGFWGSVKASCWSYLYADRVSAGSLAGGSTLAPPQYGSAFKRTRQAKLDLNGNALDDYGNSWTNTGVTFASATPRYAGTSYAVFAGSATNIIGSDINYLNVGAGGAFTLAFSFYASTLSNNGLVRLSNAANMGLSIGYLSTGKF